MAEVIATVVTPAYNRPDELRRALDSLVAQTMPDFECIVVDDASTTPIEPVVADYDERFIYVRNPTNSGCTAARFLGFERMRGDYLLMLDSDNVLFPEALGRAHELLGRHPEVGGVTGLYEYPDGLHVSVAGGAAVLTPHDYVTGNGCLPGTSDCVGVVRRQTVDEWLTERRRDYYRLDFIYWLSHRLRHSQLFVDEPWGRYHVDAPHRVTTTFDNSRYWRDIVTLVEDFRPELGTQPCVPLDRFLRTSWVSMIRAGRRKEAAVVRMWMDERGSSAIRAIGERIQQSLHSRLAAYRGHRVTHIEPRTHANGASPDAAVLAAAPPGD